MPAGRLYTRLERSKAASLKKERDKGTHRDHRPDKMDGQGDKRPHDFPHSQPGRPAGPRQGDFIPPGRTSSGSSGRERITHSLIGTGDDPPDSPQAVSSTSPQIQQTLEPIAVTMLPSDIAFSPTATSFSIDISTSAIANPTSTMAFGTTLSNPTLTDVRGQPSSTLTTSLTSSLLVLPSSRVSATPTSSNPIYAAVDVTNHPTDKAAVIVPSILGPLMGVAAVYLLHRYCTPLKTRWAIYRARRGQRLRGEVEEVGTDSSVPPQMSEAYATGTTEPSGASCSAQSVPPTPSTMVISYIRDTAIALPITSTTFPQPVLVRKPLRNSPPPIPIIIKPHVRKVSGDAGRVRTRKHHNSSAPPPTYSSNGQGPDVLNFSSIAPTAARKSHPGGLTNNPPTPVVGRTRPPPEADRVYSTIPIIPVGIDPASDVSIKLPVPPRFPAPSLPESVFSPSERLRKSITPSESVSNIPDSPISLGLMPSNTGIDSLTVESQLVERLGGKDAG